MFSKNTKYNISFSVLIWKYLTYPHGLKDKIYHRFHFLTSFKTVATGALHEAIRLEMGRAELRTRVGSWELWMKLHLQSFFSKMLLEYRSVHLMMLVTNWSQQWRQNVSKEYLWMMDEILLYTYINFGGIRISLGPRSGVGFRSSTWVYYCRWLL